MGTQDYSKGYDSSDAGPTNSGGTSNNNNSNNNSNSNNNNNSNHSAEHEVDNSVGGGNNNNNNNNNNGNDYGQSPGGNNNNGGGGGNNNNNNTPGNSYAGQDTSPGTSPGTNANAGGGGNNTPNPGYGWSTAHSVERGIDTSLGTPTGFQGTGGTAGRVTATPTGIDPGRFGPTTTTTTPTGSARVTNDLPTGFDPTRIGPTIRETLNNPISYDPITGMVGAAVQQGAINPNISPARFGEEITGPTGIDPARLADPTAGTSLANTGLPTGFDAARMGGAVDPTAGVNRDRFGPVDPTAGVDPARFGGTVDPTAGVNVDRFGYAVPTSVAGPRTRGLGTVSGVTPTEMPNQPAADRFGPTPTGYPSAGMPVGPVGPIQSAISPTGTVAAPTIVDAPRVKGELADFKMDGDPAPNTEISDAVRASVRDVMGPDWEVYGTSGKRAKGAGAPGRHSLGIALDFAVRNTKTGQVLDYHKAADAAKMREIAEYGMRNYGIQGVGVGKNYMSGTHMHLDLASKSLDPKTQGKQWMDAKNYTQTWDAARQAYTRTGPPTATAPQQSVASMLADPAERTPQMAALDELSGASGQNTQIGGVTPSVDAAGRTVSTAAPGTGGYPETPTQADPTTTSATPTGFPSVPSAQPQAAGFPSFATPATDYKRGPLGMLAALGIDAVASIAGGPVSLAAQGGAYMLTGDTIGGTVVDMAGGKYGPNQYQPGADDRYSGDRGTVGSGGGPNRGVNNPITTSKTPAVKPGETTETTDETSLPYEQAFVAKYIDRPTAAEKWGKLTKWTDYA